MIDNKIDHFIDDFTKTHSMQEVHNLWSLYNFSDKDNLIVSSSNSNWNFVPNVKTYCGNYLVSYFSKTKLFIINNKNINQIQSNGSTNIAIDYSIMFDTNISSYINAIMNKKNKVIKPALVQVLTHILQDDFHFDFTFYLMENIRFIDTHCENKYLLWDGLNHALKENIISLIKFKHIPKLNAQSFQTSISNKDALDEAVEIVFSFYNKDNEFIELIKNMQFSMQFLILKIIEIKYQNKK